MELKLTIIKKKSSIPPEEKNFNTAHITIGRHQNNDIHLNDPCMSRFHAKIIQREVGAYQFVCFKKDRAKINDQSLEADHPVDLSDGDQVNLPGYTITVNTIEEETVERKNTDHTNPLLLNRKPGEKAETVPEKSLDKAGTIIVHVKPRSKNEIHRLAKNLAYKLRQTYAHLFFETKEKKMRALKACIDETCATIVLPELRKEIFFFTNNLFQSPGQSNNVSPWIEDPKKNVAPKIITDIAKKLHVPPPSQNENSEFEKFGQHWTAIIKLLLEALYHNIQLSQTIKKEFEEMTPIVLPNKSNPLQNFTSINQLSDYLLNWKKGELKKISKNLQDLLDNIIAQQQYFPENMQKGYRKILCELSPEVIEKEVHHQINASFVEKIVRSKQKKMWKQYVEKHKQFSDAIQKKSRALEN